MTNGTNSFEQAREKVAQEERRRIRDTNRENDRQRKIDTRRQIIIGGIVTKYFPAVFKLQPQLRRTDTNAEFAGLEKFVSTIAADPKLSALFQELIGEELSVENRQVK